MTDDAPFDASVMEGRLSELIALPDHRMALGLQHLDGAGLRVCVWDGERLRHMSAARARRWADELEAGPFGDAFTPVGDALRTLAGKVAEIEAMVAANQAAQFAGMPVEGHA